jgi:membrane carboxypeptidase/penicillin-binding protein
MKGEVLEENIPFVELEENGEQNQDETKEEEPKTPSTSEPLRSDLKDQIISPQHAFIMTHLLQGVVQHGTGQRAKDLGRPIAGKTGTSSDYADAWFIGYTPSLLTSVWVGFDDKTSLGEKETGARAALPVWIYFMEDALRDTPIEHFPVPSGITMMKVDLRTGLPNPNGSQETIMEAFLDGTLPPLSQISQGMELPHGGVSGSILPEPRIDGP